MKTAVIYARYSSDKQTEQSIEGQLRVCNEYAVRNDISIIDTYVDRAMTGKNDKRTDFQRMLRDSSKKAWDYVLVYKIDRFGRNKYEIAMNKHTLKLNGIKLISCMENIPDTPEGIILESLLEGMAEYYSAELSQKVKRGMRESREKGHYLGGYVMYGYKLVNKKLEINEDEAEIVRYIFNEVASGRSTSEIKEELKARGVSYRGKEFCKTTFYRFLKSEKYIGIHHHEDEVYTNIYPAIVSKEIFDAVQVKLASNQYGKRSNKVKYELKGKMFCSYCGNRVTPTSGTARNGNVIRYYKCSSHKDKKKCELKPLKKEFIEDLIFRVIVNNLKDTKIMDTIIKKIVETHNKKLEDNAIVNLLYKEKEEVEMSIANVLKAIEKGVITESTQTHLMSLEIRKKALQEKITVEEANEKLKITDEEVMKYIMTAISKQKSVMLDLLIKKIMVGNENIEIYFKYNRILTDKEEKPETIYSTNTTYERQGKNSSTTVDLKIDLKI